MTQMWDERILAHLSEKNLVAAVGRLFEHQLDSWPMLRSGVDGLAAAQTKTFRIRWFDVVVRHIPHRIASTTAPVDEASLKGRQCFLCPENLPSEERAVAFDADWIIFCNPFPILDRHLSIVNRRHTPQRIAGQLAAMLELAEALPGYFVIYNGPECGASAPDHLHFQACSRTLLPIQHDVARSCGFVLNDYGRRVLVFHGGDKEALVRQLDRTVGILSAVTQRRLEPLINIAAFKGAGAWTACVFPRGKHRPQVFQTKELTVSPAAIDLCGIFVVPLERDFAKITANDIEGIFEEVTLPEDQFALAVSRLEEKR